MAGDASQIQIAGFLIALRTKGETVDELTGLPSTMRRLAAPVTVRHADLLDTAGTGGGRRTFNVSTTAALIAAGAGCTVAKHGNRSQLDCRARPICSRRSAHGSTCVPTRSRGASRRPASGSCSRRRITRRRATDHGARGDRRAHDLQLPRAADQPGRSRRQLIGVSDAAFWRRWRVRSSCSEPSMRWSSQRRRSRRALHLGTDARRRSHPRAIIGYEITPEEVGLARAPARRCRRRPGPQRRDHPPHLRGAGAGRPGAPTSPPGLAC